MPDYMILKHSLLIHFTTANALAGVPDGRGGVLPALKQPVSPTTGESRLPFLTSSVGGGGPPPLNIQRPQRTVPGPLIGGRPPLTAPAGGLSRGLFPSITPTRPVRQVTKVLSCLISISQIVTMLF